MDHMVYSALRRKLAAAEAAGDFERIERIRGMLAVSATVATAPADLIEIIEPPIHHQVIDLPDVTDLDESIVDGDE